MRDLFLAIGKIAFEGGIPMALFYALLGFAFVLMGITLLILIFTGIGKIMKKVNARKITEERERKKEKHASQHAPAVQAEEEGVSPELIAVISAAIAAYYEGTQQKCDFVVRRIKRI